jgi:hypothetical protein
MEMSGGRSGNEVETKARNEAERSEEGCERSENEAKTKRERSGNKAKVRAKGVLTVRRAGAAAGPCHPHVPAPHQGGAGDAL